MVRSETKVTSKVIEAGKNLKIIGRAGVGVDNIDVEAATQKGVIVVNSPDGNTNAAAEHTIALMLSMARNIPKASQSTKMGLWERSKFTGVEVFGKTLGIIGLGKIGSHVAHVATALGMKVLVCDPYTSKETVEAIGAQYVSKLDDFWAKCDFITIHAPKTKETTHLINKDTISKMKKGVRIINCARGGIVDESALKEAMESGQVSAAAIDVYEDEPNIKNSPLINIEGNIVLTPHLGASTAEAQLNVAIDVANQIKEVLTGGSASSAVNIPSLKPDKLEPVKDYMQIAQNIGEFAMQIVSGNLKSIEITATGNLTSLDISPLEVAIIKGIFSSFVENVNFVNAPVLAKQKGISVTTSKTDKTCNYIGLLSVKLITDIQEATVSGALVAENMQRIVKINQYTTSIEPEKHLILVPHENKPSMIAQVATVIGGHGININHMHVVQKTGENSIMIINTDKAVDSDVLDKISKIKGVCSSKYIKLST
ncbi:MAG TPA: phosphoglycerate dehydrogenase, partial [Candidatus Gastranaerophilaceae bacterium]|nr:phosphoglycerate dehydrogenase [Candidatus Gastranaerophilaceae bacterium]